MTSPLHAAFSNALSDTPELPESIQYMPPGRHRIRATQAGKPLTVEVTVDAQTAATLQSFLAAKLAAATDGRDDRPFFDFNHEDREAAAWPTEFFWAGDDPKTGGVRARLEWSDAGRRAVEGRTFRRFSPTFHLDASGHVTSSEINMGGLVNRAAFKRIAPLFASATSVSSDTTPNSPTPEPKTQNPEPKTQNSPVPATAVAPDSSATSPSVPHSLTPEPNGAAPSLPQSLTPSPALRAGVDTPPATTPMQALLSSLRSLGLIDARASDEPDIVTQLTTTVGSLKSQITDLESALATQARQRAESVVDTAVRAGRLAAKDTDARAFWIDAILRDESKAMKALDALPVNPVLARLVPGSTDTSASAGSLLTRQEQKLAAVRAAHPAADFATIYAKAKAESPDLFR